MPPLKLSSDQPARSGKTAPPGPASKPRRNLRLILGLLAALAGTAVAGLVYLGRDLGGPPISNERIAAPDAALVAEAASELEALAWPEEPLSGDAAKRLLLRVVEAASERLEAVRAYTARLVRQERVDGKLGPEQTLELKVRHDPFAVYLRFVQPDAGKEAIFAAGFHDEDVVAHGGGLTRLLLPHLKVAPTSRLAMAGNRHPITDAGLLNLTRKLVRFRKLDLTDTDARTTLDQALDEQGRHWLRARHWHTIESPERPFAYVEVLFDPETKLPHQLSAYGWPKGAEERGPLEEQYRYEDLVLDPPLTDLDFDYRNPAYEFRRY